jgi:hypothetical protein
LAAATSARAFSISSARAPRVVRVLGRLRRGHGGARSTLRHLRQPALDAKLRLGLANPSVRERDQGACLVDLGMFRSRVELDESLTGFHGLPLADENPIHPPA